MRTLKFISPRAGSTGLLLLTACALFFEVPRVHAFGSFETPFSARSYWNIRPVGPKFGSFQIPDSSYYPRVGEGAYSSAAFLAVENDRPMRVIGKAGQPGVWELDGEQFVDEVLIERWPASTLPATGSDGHADVVDPISGVVHSFFNLKKDDKGRWTAAMYAWTRLSGRGWSEPGHYYQGARATAVPPLAGLIRKHEVNDGKPMYRHALAISLTYNALSNTRAYVFPASSADATWKQNSGRIPQGALLMLPEHFDTGTIDDPALRKVAETLKVYGAYVVDRNVGTPFYIYVENGAHFDLHKPKWNSQAASGLKRIQRELRQVTSVNGWLDGHGKAFTPRESLNMASMRGSWVKLSGSGSARYDTWSQSVVMTGVDHKTQFQNHSNRIFNSTDWGNMRVGKRYALRVQSTHGAQLELRITGSENNRLLFDSGWLNNGDSYTFTWPAGAKKTSMRIANIKSRKSGNEKISVRAMVYPVDELITNPLDDSAVRSY